MTKYLGIDYGLAHLGLSVADSVLATPLPPLSNNQTTLARLTALIKAEGITLVVCGLPEGRLAPIVTRFAKQLEVSAQVPVGLHLETLTTQEARQKLQEGGASRTKRKNDHAYAACLILEDYLEFDN